MSTVLAVALEVPDGGLDHRIDLAVVALRPTDDRYMLVGRLRCALHAGMAAAAIAECCGLPLDQVLEQTPAAVTLGMLERHLAVPPYLLATHQAAELTKLIGRHGGRCPTLRSTELVDTAALAHHLLGDGCPLVLPDLATHLGVTLAPQPARTAAHAALTAAVYAGLSQIAADRDQGRTGSAAANPRPTADGRRPHGAAAGRLLRCHGTEGPYPRAVATY
ncbi:hypothetical protein KGA66_12365 [Actinocrinis puniceicyclus]|uniref:Uncharacterized protein n=1 Tax=Actinocrinis puniceicyclus TaxID=977794 RepID=A0A8J7WN86_9ACTN|nr:hypothetical protein [Actinocrinis puniceicyclus]MBS2963845.1 hypothetical protein [Actinocrinis puniceicyclus]